MIIKDISLFLHILNCLKQVSFKTSEWEIKEAARLAEIAEAELQKALKAKASELESEHGEWNPASKYLKQAETYVKTSGASGEKRN